jgi:hypothetical protein
MKTFWLSLVTIVCVCGCVAIAEAGGYGIDPPSLGGSGTNADLSAYATNIYGANRGALAIIDGAGIAAVGGVTNGSPLNATNIYGILPGGVLGTSVVRTVGGITTAGSITLTGSGSATVPLLQFGSTNTGFYTSSGNFVFVRAGNNVFTAYSTYFRLNKLLYMSVNGTGAAPAITFEDDTATGMWLPSVGSLGISANKTNMVTVTSRSVTISNLVAVGLSNIILPTSTNGLPTGALWNSNGVPAIVAP